LQEYYNQLVQSGKIKADAAQNALAEKLELLEIGLTEHVRKRGFFRKKAPIPKGVFIYGKVVAN